MIVTMISIDDGGRAVDNAYVHHKSLWNAFAMRSDVNRQFLFRVLPRTSRAVANYLVMSRDFPSLTDKSVKGYQVLDTDALSSFSTVGARLDFSLTANPSRFEFERHAAVSELTKKYPDPVEWLRAKLAGARLDECIPKRVFRSAFDKNGMRGEHIGADFEGRLTVIDPVKFKQDMATGIGRAKAFGFGLLAKKEWLKAV